MVQGIVQGVGFRPFVYNLARQLELNGFVLNNSDGVTIEVEGLPATLAVFEQRLATETPALACIDSLTIVPLEPLYQSGFVIAHSEASSQRHTLISPDTAVCNDCLAELFNPADRRYHYPFINCTNCGPRFTIVLDVPYDRDKTTMRRFPMCAKCQAEYEDPTNRRFHAQPNACPVCGPQLRLLKSDGHLIATTDPVEEAVQQLAAGAIVAIKGLGGYHLACNAADPAAVARLRQRKKRDAKPFALMVADLATARAFCEVSEAEAELLTARQRPIVLLRQRNVTSLAPDIAPGLNTLGLMLPYTPLHHLLLRAFSQTGEDSALIMTSANLSDEPIAYRDEEIFSRLDAIADFCLTHNRDIHMRCDDSVARITANTVQFMRRSRGYAPEPLALPFAASQDLLACGGHLKNTFCLVKGKQAFLSHHIGDLENLETYTSFREGIKHFGQLFDIAPQVVAYDLHPEYLATKYALELALPLKFGVQHHHAHIASVMTEHGLSGPVIGLASDGTGYGTDGKIWGGEVLIATLSDFERALHLDYVPLPGGEQAVLQPWRIALAYLWKAYGDRLFDLNIELVKQLDLKQARVLVRMLENNLNSPQTSSLGRLFDAVAALAGVRRQICYEGQAAIELEIVAAPGLDYYPFSIENPSGTVAARLNVLPMIDAIVTDLQRGASQSEIAGRFHRTVAIFLLESCEYVRQTKGLNEVVVSGGVFQNRFLLELLLKKLEANNFKVYLNRRVPPNDGGLSYGQAAVALARLQKLKGEN
jgi:hydrogenase maturation protein HypF